MEKNNHTPFLWEHLCFIDKQTNLTGGEERPLTKSANEESSCDIVELD